MDALTDILIQLKQIDYISIVKLLSPIITYYTANKAIDSYILHKNFTPTNISKINLPPELTQEYSSIDIENLAAQHFGDAIAEFAKTMIVKFPSKDLTLFYNNLNELKVDTKKFRFHNLIFRTNDAASYNPITNQIQIDEDDYTSTIYHELFRMSSSTYKNGIGYSGFSQVSPEKVILGKYLNKGYTQLLTERYFGYIGEVCGIYEFEVHIASKVETIVGQKKMESLYLNADLPGLMNELKNYISEDEIIKFISEMDVSSKLIHKQELRPPEQEMLTSTLQHINKFLLKAYAIKLKRKLDSQTMNINEFNESLTMYLSSLWANLQIEKNISEYLTPKMVQESLRTILNMPDLNVHVVQTANESIPKSR